MKSYRETLVAGVTSTFAVGGRVFYIQRSPEGMVLDVEFTRFQRASQKLERVGKGLRVAPTEPFDGVKITSSVSQVIDFIVTDGNIEIAFDEDKTIIGNEDAFAVPVRTPVGQPLEVLFAGTVEPVLGEVTQPPGEVFLVQENKLLNVLNLAPVVAGLAQVVLSNDATLQQLRVLNNHPSALVAIGGMGVTLANAAIILGPGALWVEEDAPGAAWYAISDTANVSVKLQGIK